MGDVTFNAMREAKALSDQERRYLLCTPRQEPQDAGIISYRAGDRSGGSKFAGFARRQAWLFQRMRNSYGTGFTYRLSVDGQFVADAAKAIS